MAKLESARSRKRLQDKTFNYLTVLVENTKVQYPGATEDKLYKATYRHMHHDLSTCTACARCEEEDVSACDVALKSSCSELRCDENMLVHRDRLDRAMNGIHQGETAEQKPVVHYGLVASGDSDMKSGKHRDRIAAEGKLLHLRWKVLASGTIYHLSLSKGFVTTETVTRTKLGRTMPQQQLLLV